ncbi:MAG TPA: hypothetical protein VL069_13570 [Opitutus sp.]|nr:hypothetical protein [Opitutus sp.]
MSTSVAHHEAPWRAGFRSARANVIPGFVLQLMALALVTAYYHHEATRTALDRFASWRVEVGLISAMLSTGFFGGLLPLFYLRLQRSTRSHYNLLQGAAITVFWAYKGVEVDVLYRLLARYVGTGNEVSTIAIKTMIDQFIYCPLLAVPITVLFYDWVGVRFDTRAWIKDIQAAGWFRRKILPLLISNFWVWLPTACIIYSLPTPLQLPLQNLVLCFYTLLVAHLSRRSELPA